MEKSNVIQEKSYRFAVNIVFLVREFPKSVEGYVIAKQLLKAATSVGANVEEALGGYSKQDFIFKMSIALKEARESIYWLKIVKDSQLVKCNIDVYLDKAIELRKILTSIIKTSRRHC
ncbi:four helix bundle protein [candidate division KSB1 bacterium]|nr:four helix bundle protein [candidate division KSB1 bacterium]